jgi:hypothetical protein
MTLVRPGREPLNVAASVLPGVPRRRFDQEGRCEGVDTEFCNEWRGPTDSPPLLAHAVAYPDWDCAAGPERISRQAIELLREYTRVRSSFPLKGIHVGNKTRQRAPAMRSK